MKKPVTKAIADGPRIVRCQRMAANFDVVPGVLILGDALNTRHPVTASGMTVALNDVMFWWKFFTMGSGHSFSKVFFFLALCHKILSFQKTFGIYCKPRINFWSSLKPWYIILYIITKLMQCYLICTLVTIAGGRYQICGLLWRNREQVASDIRLITDLRFNTHGDQQSRLWLVIIN